MNKFSKIAKIAIILMSLMDVTYAENNASHHSLLTRWTGFYAGMNAGYAYNNVQLKSQHLGFTDPSETCNTGSNFSTFFPGAQLGYLYQFSNDVVSGVETTIALNTPQKDILRCRSSINPIVSDCFAVRNQMQASIRGRVGHVVSWNKTSFLPYLTTGVSFAKMGLTYTNEGSDYYSQNTIQPGWLLGTGIEWVIKQDWSLRIEYYYLKYANNFQMDIPIVYDLTDTNGKARAYLSSNNFTISINYWI